MKTYTIKPLEWQRSGYGRCAQGALEYIIEPGNLPWHDLPGKWVLSVNCIGWDGIEKIDSYPTEQEAIDAAEEHNRNHLEKQLNEYKLQAWNTGTPPFNELLLVCFGARVVGAYGYSVATWIPSIGWTDMNGTRLEVKGDTVMGWMKLPELP